MLFGWIGNEEKIITKFSFLQGFTEIIFAGWLHLVSKPANKKLQETLVYLSCVPLILIVQNYQISKEV